MENRQVYLSALKYYFQARLVDVSKERASSRSYQRHHWQISKLRAERYARLISDPMARADIKGRIASFVQR